MDDEITQNTLGKEDTYEVESSLEWVLNKIDKDLKQIVVLYYYDELSVTEIGNILEIPAGTVKSRLSRAREQISKIIKNKNKMPDKFIADRDSEIELENDILDIQIKDDKNKTVIAVTNKGERIAIWNQQRKLKYKKSKNLNKNFKIVKKNEKVLDFRYFFCYNSSRVLITQREL